MFGSISNIFKEIHYGKDIHTLQRMKFARLSKFTDIKDKLHPTEQIDDYILYGGIGGCCIKKDWVRVKVLVGDSDEKYLELGGHNLTYIKSASVRFLHYLDDSLKNGRGYVPLFRLKDRDKASFVQQLKMHEIVYVDKKLLDELKTVKNNFVWKDVFEMLKITSDELRLIQRSDGSYSGYENYQSDLRSINIGFLESYLKW